MTLSYWMTPWIDFSTTVVIMASFLVPLAIWIGFLFYRLSVIIELSYDVHEDALDILNEYYKSRATEELTRYEDLNEYLFDCGGYVSMVPSGEPYFHETLDFNSYAEETDGAYMDPVDSPYDPFGQEHVEDDIGISTIHNKYQKIFTRWTDRERQN